MAAAHANMELKSGATNSENMAIAPREPEGKSGEVRSRNPTVPDAERNVRALETKKRKKKIVVLNNKGLISILDLLDEVLRNHYPDPETLAELEIKPGPIEQRPGWRPKVKSAFEWLFDCKLGSKQRVLKSFSFAMDPVPQKVYEEYVEYLNSLLASVKMKSTHAERERIGSRFILVRELLIRLAALTLSRNNPDLKRDNNVLLQVLIDFHDRIHKNPAVLRDGFFRQQIRQADQFRVALLKVEHDKLFQNINETIKLMRLEDLPRTIFEKVRNYLENIELVIKRQLCVWIDNSDIVPADLELDFIRHTFLNKCRRKIIDAVTGKLNVKKVDPRHLRIINALLGLLAETEHLQKNTNSLFKIAQKTGWMIFIPEIFLVDKFIKNLRDHWKKCGEILCFNSIPGNKSLRNKLNDALSALDSDLNVKSPEDLFHSVDGLKALQNEELIQIIVSEIARDYADLKEEKCDFIDVEKLERMVGAIRTVANTRGGSYNKIYHRQPGFLPSQQTTAELEYKHEGQEYHVEEPASPSIIASATRSTSLQFSHDIPDPIPSSVQVGNSGSFHI